MRNARLYLIGLAASAFGDSAMILVAAIWIKSLTGSNSAAAVVSVCLYAPSLLGPFAGMLADRVRRKPLLIVVNLAGAAIMVPLLAVHDRSQAWLIYAAMAGYGACLVLIDPAESALFTVMLPDHIRQRVNGLRLTLQEGAKLTAPLVGAGLFTVLGGGWVAAIDALTFVIATLMISALRVREPPPAPPAPPERHWRRELLEGIGHLWRNPDLRAVTAAAAVAMFISGIGSAARYSLLDALHRPPAFLGVLTAALGAGSIVAGLTCSPMITRFGERRVVLFGLINGAAGNLLSATGWLPAAVTGSVIAGFALPWVVIALINLTQRRTPNELQGRVSSAITLLLFAPLPFSHGLGALAVAHFAFWQLYVVTAAVTLGATPLLSRRTG
jgi:MFS family permease